MILLRPYLVLAIFIIVYLPRICGRIPADIISMGIFLILYMGYVANRSKGKHSVIVLDKLWMFFIPIFAFSFIPAAAQGDLYWIIWCSYTVIVAYTLPRIGSLLTTRQLNVSFYLCSLVVVCAIICELFGPKEVREYLGSLKISENVETIQEYLIRFVGRYTGIIADVPSTGGVLSLSIAVLTVFCCKKKAAEGTFACVLLTMMLFSMLFSSRLWLLMTAAFLIATVLLGRRPLAIVGGIIGLTIFIMAVEFSEPVAAAVDMVKIVLPLLLLETEKVNAFSTVAQEYSALDMYANLGIFQQLFGTGVTARYSYLPTDIGFLKYLICIGLLGTMVFVLSYLGVFFWLIYKYRGNLWMAPIAFSTMALIAYNIKGTSLYGLYFFPMYVLLLTVCIKNAEEDKEKRQLFFKGY